MTPTMNAVTPAALMAALSGPMDALAQALARSARWRHTLAPMFVGYGAAVPALAKPEPLKGGESRQVRRAALRKAAFWGMRNSDVPEVRRLSRRSARFFVMAMQVNNAAVSQ